MVEKLYHRLEAL
jgi:hypothetical protein